LACLFRFAFSAYALVSCAVAASPNIIFILFDDLGFADVSFNGGTVPTPVLDALVADNAIQLDYHYAEPMCSITRSALYTGRYAHRSGLTTVVRANHGEHISRDAIFFPQVLSDNDYRTFIAGKWHVGIKYEDILPARKGFSDGTYQRQFSEYRVRTRTHGFNETFDRTSRTPLFDEFPTSNDSLKARLVELFGGNLRTHDLWRIEDGQDVAVLVGDNSYSEDIYTESVIDFIDDVQNATNPFYIQYNLYTPHWSLEEPPELSDAFRSRHSYNSTCDDVSDSERRLLCRVLLYAQQKIEEIVNKTKDAGLWEDTLLLISSDNGPDTRNDAFGQTLPLRSNKARIFDGGLRTAAFLIGGYVESVLSSLTATTSHCVYDGLVHVSDWFNVFTDIAGIEHEFADADHQQQIWSDIQCQCDAACDDDTSEAMARTELISMHVCKSGALFASTIIRDGWKLVVNGSRASQSGCPASASSAYLYWTRSDDTAYARPNSTFYEEQYERQFGLDADRAERLFVSDCLEEMYLNGSIDDDANPFFSNGALEADIMLFELSVDRIEACNVAESEPDKVAELMKALLNRTSEFDGTVDVLPSSVGAVAALIDSYECERDISFRMPWEGHNESLCGDESVTMDSVDARECAPLWTMLLEKKEACLGVSDDDGSTSESAEDNDSAAKAVAVYLAFAVYILSSVVQL